MPAQDAFYRLCDSLLSLILSKMPIKDAVKCCILSKRWRFLYTQMPELTFSPDLVLGPGCPSRLDPLLLSRVENIISNILLLQSQNLEALHLHHAGFDHNQRSFSHENVCKWVMHASRCNVQHLTLFDHYRERADERHRALKETPPPSLFLCSRLVTLYLRDYILTSLPINFVGFPNLLTCHLHNVQLTDESLVSFISLCPLLEDLFVTGDYGLNNVVISSSTIEHLDMCRVKSLSVNCPKIKVFSGNMIEDLSVNGARLYELSYAVLELKMHCASTPKELDLDCSQEGRPEVISASRFLHIVGNFQSLEELTIFMDEPFEREAEMDVPLLNLLHRLPNLQSLNMFGFFVQELARDPIPVCLASPHVNLKKIGVDILEFDDKEIEVIGCLLQSTPFLERMEIQVPDEGCDDGECTSFYIAISSLRRASRLARIIVP